MKPKKKRKISERESTAASYVISAFLHALLILFLAALFGQAGGSVAGGVESGRILPIGLVAAPGPPATEAAPGPAAATVPIPRPEEVNPTESPVKIKTKPDKEKPEKVERKVEALKPRTVAGAGTNVTNPATEGAEAHGEGGAEARNTSGTGGGGSGTGAGGNVGAGKGSGIFPFPRNIFNLSPDLVPDCKKDDSDNDKLSFRYNVSYSKKSLTVVFTGSTAPADPSTIAQTRRVVEMNFSSGGLEDDVTYKGFIDCRCGSYPRCELKDQ